MRGWLLDTNVIASLIAADGAPSVRRWAALQDERHMYFSVITLAEYDRGIHQLPEDDPNRARYALARDALELRFARRLLPVGNDVVRRWGALSGRIRRETGHPPPVVDTLLAATALEAGFYLVTRNVKDVRRTGALLFNPWTDDPASAALML